MAQQIPNSFSSYELSEAEVLQGSILNPAQKLVVQNELSMVSQQILDLRLDPLNPMSHVQEDSYLKGQMSILRLFLLRSEESEHKLLNLAHNS